MLYVICDPVAEKERLSFTGHTEEMSCSLLPQWEEDWLWAEGETEEEDSRGSYMRKKTPEERRDAQEEMLTIHSESLQPLLQLTCVHYILFFSFNWGHFQKFPSAFPALGKSQAHLWHLADSLLSEGKVANESLCNCLCYKPKYTTASFTLTTQRAFFLLNWKCGTQQSL